MTKITESAVEIFAIELLKKNGYQYICIPDIAPDRDAPVPLALEVQEQEQQPGSEVPLPLGKAGLQNNLLLKKALYPSRNTGHPRRSLPVAWPAAGVHFSRFPTICIRIRTTVKTSYAAETSGEFLRV